MKERIGKTVAILGLAPLLFFGCRQPALVAGGYAEDPRTLRVVVHAFGLYSIKGDHMTSDLFRHVAVRRWRRYQEAYPIVFLPEQNAVFSHVWEAMEMAAGIGLWRQGIEIEGRTVEVSVPARDPGPPNSPVRLLGFTGNTVPESVQLLRMTRETVELNGQRSDPAKIKRYFKKLTDKTTPFLILPADEAPMAFVGKVLKALSDAGMENMYLSMVWKEAEDYHSSNNL